MGIHTKEIFWIVNTMAMALCYGLTEQSIKDSGRMDAGMGKANILSFGTVNTKDSGKIVCTMATESSLVRMGPFTKEFL